MRDLDPWVLLAVLQEMAGPLLWVLVGLAVLGLAAFALTLRAERRLHGQRLMWAEAVGGLGGVLALVVMALVTHSGFTDAGGPVDWLLIGGVFGVGAAGTTILAYGVIGLVQSGGFSRES